VCEENREHGIQIVDFEGLVEVTESILNFNEKNGIDMN
jgi:hypothetical protein